MRTLAKRVVEGLATRSPATAIARRLHRSSVAVIAYHNVVPSDEARHGDVSLHLPLPTFIAQIERLASSHRLLDLDQAADEAGAQPRGRPAAVITFDDAYRGAILHAAPVLRHRGIPAVVFVSPGLVEARTTWWDDLGEAGKLDEETRSRALNELGGQAGPVREWARTGSEQTSLPRSYGIASEEEIRQCAGGGITIGSHAWGHEHLPSLDEGELRDNLLRSLQWIRRFGDDASEWLALPYGAGSDAVVQAALRVGHRGVLRIEGGLWNPNRQRSLVPRINVPAGLSARGLEMRTSGLRRG